MISAGCVSSLHVSCLAVHGRSSKSGDKLTTLDEYISRMKEGQKSIYYLAGEPAEAGTEQPPFRMPNSLGQ